MYWNRSSGTVTERLSSQTRVNGWQCCFAHEKLHTYGSPPHFSESQNNFLFLYLLSFVDLVSVNGISLRNNVWWGGVRSISFPRNERPRTPRLSSTLGQLFLPIEVFAIFISDKINDKRNFTNVPVRFNIPNDFLLLSFLSTSSARSCKTVLEKTPWPGLTFISLLRKSRFHDRSRQSHQFLCSLQVNFVYIQYTYDVVR